MPEATDHISRDYFEEKFQGMYRLQKDMQEAMVRRDEKDSTDKSDLFKRIGKAEGEISTIKETRPTIGKILAAIVTVSGLLITVAQLIWK